MKEKAKSTRGCGGPRSGWLFWRVFWSSSSVTAHRPRKSWVYLDEAARRMAALGHVLPSGTRPWQCPVASTPDVAAQGFFDQSPSPALEDRPSGRCYRSR
jgi:hypothetical protein